MATLASEAGMMAVPRWQSIGRAALALAAPALVALIPMAVASALPAMARDLAPGKDGAFFAQMIMTMPAVMLIVGAPLASLLCERIGIRTTFAAAAALFTVAGAAGLFLDGFTALAVSRLLLGMSGGALQTCTLALVGRWYGPGPRERILGNIVSVSSAFAIAGLVAGGWLVDLFGWRACFGLYLLGAPLFVLTLLVVERGILGERPQAGGSLAALKPLIAYYGLMLAFTLAMFMPGIQGPFLVAAKGVEGAAAGSLIVAACPLGAVLSSASFAAVRARVGTLPLLAATALLLGGGCLVSAYSSGLPMLLAGFAMIGLGAGLVEPNIGSIILGRTPHSLHARASSIMISAMFLGQFLNPLAADPLRAQMGVNGAFIGVGYATVLLGAALLALAALRRPRTAC
jgi:MFS family permease